MVESTNAPPERLYRPDVSLLEWRRLAEEGNPFAPPPDIQEAAELTLRALGRAAEPDGRLVTRRASRTTTSTTLGTAGPPSSCTGRPRLHRLVRLRPGGAPLRRGPACDLVDLLQYGQSAKPIINGPMWDYHAR